MKIKSGDTVEITTGKDKGRQGPVEKILRQSGKVKVVIAGLNLATKHRKSQNQGRGGKTGGRIEMPMPISVSNVMLICKNCNLKTRVGYEITDDKKVRVCKKCKKVI